MNVKWNSCCPAVPCAMLLLSLGAAPALGAPPGRIQLAVAEQDIEAIAKVVGGGQVDTFTLFTGCILRKDLSVEAGVKARLLKADAVVWTGFLNESAAIQESLRASDPKGLGGSEKLPWIDVSRGVVRIDVPTSTCGDYVDPSLMNGNPFFWLNPRNGAIIARNIAEGLALLRPESRTAFLANADRFEGELKRAIAKWQEELKPLSKLVVFSTQCGWQNFSQIGGPTFVVCKNTPGILPPPAVLVAHIKEMKVQVVLVDSNTPATYGRAFREGTKARVIELPSSIEKVPGAKCYFDLFDNLVKILREASGP